jgi:nucleoside-diphosphate-sugar epimerase
LVTQLRPDAIIHLAARAGVQPSIEAPALYTEVNVSGTVRWLEAASRPTDETISVCTHRIFHRAGSNRVRTVCPHLGHSSHLRSPERPVSNPSCADRFRHSHMAGSRPHVPDRAPIERY